MLWLVAATLRAATDPLPMDYFRTETAKISASCLADVQSLDDWKARRDRLGKEAARMLDLDPLPPRTDLKPVITGTVERDGFKVEKLYFQSMPHLYVTANLYLPKGLTKRAPTILYLCGHSPVVINGVNCGNKTAYQRHGIWFARNGYVCLVIDTIDHGEIPGLHHGTYSQNQWWWNSRGYTPAAIETWDAIRALDYLETRPEVDSTRIGVTGRSGGGAYTWFLSALDDRVKVMAPVSGMTDLQNYVVDGAVDGHCDCMFFINTYRWDYPQLAALCAPRPLLLVNCDADNLFPLDGVMRLHEKVKKIYDLYGARASFGLVIAPGGHHDTQDVQVPVFRWFNIHLKGEDPIIDTSATNELSPLDLKVFKEIPADQVNTTVQTFFGQTAATPPPPNSPQEWKQMQETWRRGLKEKVFAGWPIDYRPSMITKSGITEVETRHDVRVPLMLPAKHGSAVKDLILEVRDISDWSNIKVDPNHASLGCQPGDAKARRRYMLLGQTLDGMRVWDIMQAVRVIRRAPGFEQTRITLKAEGDLGVNALYASLFEPVEALDILNIPSSQIKGPDYINVLKVLDLPQAVAMAAGRCHVRLRTQDSSGWNFLAAMRESSAVKLDLDFSLTRH